jgi:hypothetical protein
MAQGCDAAQIPQGQGSVRKLRFGIGAAGELAGDGVGGEERPSQIPAARAGALGGVDDHDQLIQYAAATVHMAVQKLTASPDTDSRVGSWSPSISVSVLQCSATRRTNSHCRRYLSPR